MVIYTMYKYAQAYVMAKNTFNLIIRGDNYG